MLTVGTLGKGQKSNSERDLILNSLFGELIWKMENE